MPWRRCSRMFWSARRRIAGRRRGSCRSSYAQLVVGRDDRVRRGVYVRTLMLWSHRQDQSLASQALSCGVVDARQASRMLFLSGQRHNRTNM